MNTKIVNLFGVPNAGKSTGAAYIFSQLKMVGVNAELVTEFAKDKVWEESSEVFKNQSYIFGKQSFKQSRVNGKVELVITDSPIVLSLFYNKNPVLGVNFEKTVLDVFNSYDNVNILLMRDRNKPYNPVGRFQTDEESKAMQEPMEDFLRGLGLRFTKAFGNKHDYDVITASLLELIRQEKECETC